MFSRELELGGRASVNFAALERVARKSLPVDGFDSFLFFNPARVASVMAKVDEESLRHRKCFLCPDGIAPEQLTYDWTAPSGSVYWIRVNPFPIFDRHYTVSFASHQRQQIEGHYEDMVSLASELPDYLVFYNGPMCGASAPDHMHFQLIPSGCLPMQEMVRRGESLRSLRERNGVKISKIEKYVEGAFVLQSSSSSALASEFFRLMSLGELQSAREWEPRVNILSWCDCGVWTTVVFFRAESRPSCFFASDEASRILISPGSVEMGGVAIVSSQDSFDKIDSCRLREIILEVSMDASKSKVMEEKLCKTQEVLSVGIVSAEVLHFNFKTPYVFEGVQFTGEHKATLRDGRVEFEGRLYDEIVFTHEGASPCFELQDVTIGVNFHWNRQEAQTFPDDLKIVVIDGQLKAINLVGIENYLVSVISSEMSATCSKQLLKAHAVISRSWILAQKEKNRVISASETPYTASVDCEDELVRWYDREDHKGFDVCADDHCQRYYGLSRASTAAVREVIDETWGEVLKYDGEICDARFSKCCGGVFEQFEYNWEPRHFDYMVARRDSPAEADFPDLTVEENARKWILSAPEAFCNTSDPHVLSQILTSFDQETQHFFRWRVEYTVEELSRLVRERSGEDYGEIMDLIPVARGTSGRIWKLKIVGSKKTKTIGKELEIRRTLSTSHLYSSAFVVEKLDGRFILRGAGWGHGAGLCQIGAAVMGEKGYRYDEILSHYFPGTTLEKLY